jgi:hypothetical protein
MERVRRHQHHPSHRARHHACLDVSSSPSLLLHTWLPLHAAMWRSLSVCFIPSRVSTATSFLASFPTVDFGTGLYLMQTMTQQKCASLAADTPACAFGFKFWCFSVTHAQLSHGCGAEPDVGEDAQVPYSPQGIQQAGPDHRHGRANPRRSHCLLCYFYIGIQHRLPPHHRRRQQRVRAPLSCLDAACRHVTLCACTHRSQSLSGQSCGR